METIDMGDLGPGDYIRFAIIKKKRRCKDVAERVAISKFYLSSIINERRMLTPKIALKLAGELGLDPVDLMQRSAKLAVERELAKTV